MAEIDRNELARIVGHHEDAELLKKDVSIIKDKKQFSVRIPTRFAELTKIDIKKDRFEFTLVPEDNGKFTIEAELKRGEDEGEKKV